MEAPKIKMLLIDERVASHPQTTSIVQRLMDVETYVIPVQDFPKYQNQLTLTQGKKVLFLTRHEGEAVKPCPATSSPYLCCQYTVISQIHQCPFDCTYCILQNYLESNIMTVFVNLEDIFSQIEHILRKHPNRFFRFGTGEFGDSLALESIIKTAPDLVEFFKQQSQCLIELKTKSNEIDHLLKLNPKNTVLSWSMNPPIVTSREEFRAATLEERLTAAQKAMDAGYLLAFHFDPLLSFTGWEVAYRFVVESILDKIDTKRIAWISFGTLRFPPNLKRIVQTRFPKSKIVYEEMISGMDGKMRYLKPIRLKMYQTIIPWFREADHDLFLYFCMESSEIWERVMGKAPESNAELDYWFAKSLYQRFPDLAIRKPRKEAYEDLTLF